MSSERPQLASEDDLVAAALELGARSVDGWTAAEERLAQRASSLEPAQVETIRQEILAGEDPLGDAFCTIRKPAIRRSHGATYTPHRIVGSMLEWAAGQRIPARVIDPGAGSGRFLLEAARRFENAELIGVELDPLAAILARANLAAANLADRSRVMVTDYRSARFPKNGGENATLFIGNPPYVRHHLISPRWKQWLSRESARLGISASHLAGLHVHFFVATALRLRPGDFGCFITAAEWLDVNYGRMVRELFSGRLGGRRLIVIEPTALPFPDATTTGAITCFEAGKKRTSVHVKRVRRTGELRDLNGGRRVGLERLAAEKRWSQLVHRRKRPAAGYVELGELCRVHRGQVTGANRVWIAGEDDADLPGCVLFPTVTRAQELYRAGRELTSDRHLRRVIDLPEDLEQLAPQDRQAVDRFLERAKAAGAHRSYIARHRKPWWSVGLREPAPILATYMARRPPAFVLNGPGVRNLNIAHGLYPRQPLTKKLLRKLVGYLSTNTRLADGRAYAGGLIKFEPREMERLLVPDPELLVKDAAPR